MVILFGLGVYACGGGGGGGGGTAPSFNVTASAGANGSISPTSVSVNQDATTSFTLTPATNYSIASVTGCGGTQSGSTYTTGAITADCAVIASFAINTYTVTTSAGANGNIDAGAVVDYASMPSFTATPDTGYHLAGITGCGAGNLIGDTYTTAAIIADCLVTASFAINTYTVTTSADINGSVSPTSASVDHGASIDFTITPNQGYLIGSVTGCGGTLSANIYTTGGISGACTVSATFTMMTVDALFSSAPDWNDYVQGDDWSTANDVACNAASDSACIHGGEYRVVVTSGLTDCTGVTATDDLGVFDWSCDAGGGTVRLISTGLADGKYLSDLIEFATPAFKTNIVTVYLNAAVWGVTSSASWWTNPVVENNSTGFDSASTIYLITANTPVQRSIGADKIALLIEPGITVNGAGVSANVVDAALLNYLWIEGSIDATNDDAGINLIDVKFSRLQNITVTNAQSEGVYLEASYSLLEKVVTDNNVTGISLVSGGFNTLTGITAANNVTGINNFNSSDNHFNELTLARNSTAGLRLVGEAHRNIVQGAMLANNGTFGVFLSGTGIINNVLSAVTSTNAANYGLHLDTGASNVLQAVTAANINLFYGVNLNNTSGNTLANMALVNSFGGLNIANASSNNRFADVTAAHCDFGVVANNTANNVFTGRLGVGNNGTDCNVTNSTLPGIDHITCAANGGSDHMLVTGITLANSFVGKTTGDTQNASDSSGTATFPVAPASFDWSGFDNALRGWGKDGSAFPSSDHRGNWSVNTGRIWDWSVSLSDNGNGGSAALLGVHSLPDGNNTLTHVWSSASVMPADDNDCDTLVMAGSKYNGSACQSVFLRHALEISADAIGNDNALCESGETCLFTPNVGSYQGHGNLLSAGAFSDGALTGITLLQYDSNGR
jgi:hypothetical protein